MHVSLRDLEEYWTLVDVLDANLMLDALDDAEARAREAVQPPEGRRG